MSKLDEDNRRIWYQRGYSQAQRNNEALVNKLVKEIADLSAQRLGLINDTGIGRSNVGVSIEELYVEKSMFIRAIQRGIELIENPDIPDADLRLKCLKDCLNGGYQTVEFGVFQSDDVSDGLT